MQDHVLSVDIMVPRQKVWDEITKLGRVQRALMNTLLETGLTPGAKLRYYSPDRKRVFIVGKVVEVVTGRKFSHTYMFTTRPETPSLVTWELQEIPGGCRVTLTHSGWTDQAKTHKSVVAGWRQILDVLKVELETGDIPFKTKMLYGMMSAFMFMMPKTTTVAEIEKAGW